MSQSYRQTAAYAEFLRQVGWQIETSSTTAGPVYAFIKHIGPVSILKLQRVDVNALDWERLKTMQKKHRVAATYIEPAGYHEEPPGKNKQLANQGYRIAADFMIPAKTRVIDLSQSQEKILADMKPKTRYNLKLALRRPLETRVISGREMTSEAGLFESYYRLLEENARRVGMFLISRKWIRGQLDAFGEKALVVQVTGKKGNQFPVAAATYFASQDTLFYTHNGSTQPGRTAMAPTLAVWTGIKEGQRRGLKYFDFDGVYDERRPKKRWFGYTRFKAGFGGEETYFELMYKQYRWPAG